MKVTLNILTLLLTLIFMNVGVTAQTCPCFVSSKPCPTGAFTPCGKTLTVATGSIYREPVTVDFSLATSSSISYCVRYSTVNKPVSFSQFGYFPVSIGYNNPYYNYGYQPENVGGGAFNIPSTPQAMTVYFDLTKFSPSPLSWNCYQTIRVDLSFKVPWSGGSVDLGMLTFYLNVVSGDSKYSMDVKNSEAFYVGNDYRLHSQKWNGLAWVYSPITPVNGGWTITLAGAWVTASPSGDHVFFSGGGKVYNIFKSGGLWYMGPLSTSGPMVKGYIRLKGSRVYYVGNDSKIHYYDWNGNAWVYNAINPLNGWTSGLVNGAMNVSQVNDELFYRSGQGALYRLYQNSGGQWSYQILLASGCAGDITVDPQTNDVYFKGTDSKVHRLAEVSSIWQHEVLNAVNSDYQVQGHLTKFAGEDRIFYIGTDGLMHNIYLNGPSWSDFPLSYSVNQVTSNSLAAEGHVFYLHGDDRIHGFRWGSTSWLEGPLVTTPANAKRCW